MEKLRFNLYEVIDHDLTDINHGVTIRVRIGSDADVYRKSASRFKFIGTEELNIEVEKKVVEKVLDLVKIERFGDVVTLDSTKILIPLVSIPDDAFDVEVHYKTRK
jgi:hypothetical protein